MDVLLSGGEVLARGRLQRANVGIRSGTVAYVGPETPEARERLDVAGCWILPGMIDTHVHFREPGRTDKEDFESGSRAAVLGGVTTVLEIQNNEPLMVDVASLESKHAAVSKTTWVNYGLYANLGVQNLDQIERLADVAAAFKVFMTQSVGPLTVTGLGDLWRAFDAVARSRKILAVHAESDAICKLAREGQDDHVRAHVRARPRIAEAIAVAEAFELAVETGARINLAHLSTGRAAELCAEARRRGIDFSAATCPQYLWFSEEDVAAGDNVFKVNPSIKGASDRAALREGLRTGVIDHVHSDHAPHTLEEKRKSYREAPSGIAGIQHQLLVLLELAKDGILTLADVVRVAAEAPAAAFDLRGRGRIETGFDADLVVVDPLAPLPVRTSELASKSGSSPWVGTTFRHRIRHTFVGGQPAVVGGVLAARPSRGRRIA